MQPFRARFDRQYELILNEARFSIDSVPVPNRIQRIKEFVDRNLLLAFTGSGQMVIQCVEQSDRGGI